MNKSSILKVVEFLLYTLGIYGCYITSGVYHEKMYAPLYSVSNINMSAM